MTLPPSTDERIGHWVRADDPALDVGVGVHGTDGPSLTPMGQPTGTLSGVRTYSLAMTPNGADTESLIPSAGVPAPHPSAARDAECPRQASTRGELNGADLPEGEVQVRIDATGPAPTARQPQLPCQDGQDPASGRGRPGRHAQCAGALMRRLVVSAILASMALMGACGSGPEDIVLTGPGAEPLRVLAKGAHGVRGPRASGVAVRNGRRVAVVAALRTTVTAASEQVMLAPDLDGDEQPEVLAKLGPELGNRLVVSLTASPRRRVEVRRAGWDIIDVAGRIGARWLVVANDPDGRSYLLGFLPRERRWTWSVRLPGHENEVDDVDVLGDRIRISVFVASDSGRSTVLDVTARGNQATVMHTERRPVQVRSSSARIDPAWRVEEVREPPREGGEQAGRVEVHRPDGSRQVLSDVDNNVPAAGLLRAGARCAVVLVVSPSGAVTVSAVAADGRILATRRIPRSGLLNIAAVGRRLIISRREGRGVVVVRALRTDARIGSCG